MEVEHDEKRIRPYSYRPSPPLSQQRMQPAESGSHAFPTQPPPGPASSYGAAAAPGWLPPPSPFAHEPRSASDLPPSSASFPLPGRDNTYHSDLPYGSRHGSISAPTRSPDAVPQSHLHNVNGSNAEGPYHSPPGLSDFRSRGGFAPPDAPPNGNHSATLHIATSQDVMSGPPPFPPTTHASYSLPQSAGLGPGPSPVYDSFYQGGGWGNSGSAGRKKPVRAQQACDSCRTRKAKCDEQRPCSHCKDNQLTCTYREIPPHKQDRNAIALEAKLDNLQREMSDMKRHQNEKLDHLLHLFEGSRRDLDPRRGGEQGYEKNDYSNSTGRRSNAWPSHIGSQAPRNSHPDGAASASRPSNAPDPNDKDDSKNSLPHRHHTGAQNLLKWPAIQAIGLQNNLNYVMLEEEQRGLLRLYGRGEGHDRTDVSQGPASPSMSSSSSRADDSPSPPADNVWGNGFKPPYPSAPGYPVDHPGGLNPDGTPNYDPDLIDKYLNSYMRHMYVLHPFLDKKTIRENTNQFKARYGRRHGKKRKLEEDSPASSNETYGSSMNNHGTGVERSIRNAIVLLVLALGKICDHRPPLPACPLTPAAAPTPRSAHIDIMSPTPMTPLPSWGSKRKSSEGTSSDRQELEKSNVDVIPGLAYFSIACDILGGLRGGFELSHAQAHLLAGLYMGQLAHVMASYDFITQAGKVCQILIDDGKFDKPNSNPKTARYLNLVKYAYWSCLQLESDILAEMPLPQSGVSRFEDFMNSHLPSGIYMSDEDIGVYRTDDDIKDVEVKYYWAQIQLRITLNTIHTLLYKDVGQDNPPALQLKVQATLAENLEDWRGFLNLRSPELAWDDEAYQATEINAARMRAKYYGAKYIINRPSLYAALHYDWASVSMRLPQGPGSGPGQGSQQASPSTSFRDSSGGMPPPHHIEPTNKADERSPDGLLPQILQGVKDCIHAAIRSTTAFDEVQPRRLIVTNIFGTAHAQFGNMLVLCAVYASYLRPLIDREVLHNLLIRTIDFLQTSADISPSLRRDMQQLQTLERNLFGEQQQMQRSFSSN